jgi:release factor glutamine methyltransferase
MQNSFKYITHQLFGLYSENEIRNCWLLIMEELTGYTRTQILINKNSILSEEQNEKMQTIAIRLQQGEPIQYILGKTEFYSLPFELTKNVLIPRPETEELVDWVLKDNLGFTGNLLDIATGSGCIAIALAKHFTKATIRAIDISEKALDVAKKNATNNAVNIDFKKMDILKTGKEKEMHCASTEDKAYYDIIISNPPYICEQEKEYMHNNVLNYEPHLALFVPDDDPLLFYKEIALFASKNLVSGGKLFFEINQRFGKEVVNLLENAGFAGICLRKDISGKDRMIKATFV